MDPEDDKMDRMVRTFTEVLKEEDCTSVEELISKAKVPKIVRRAPDLAVME